MLVHCRSRLTHRGVQRASAVRESVLTSRPAAPSASPAPRPLARMGKAGKKVLSPVKQAAQM
eukprot:4962863-Prymnesium_polylepis.1